MSKFKVHFKLQGLELDIEGTREDIPAIGQNIGAQIAGLIEPAVNIIEGDTKVRNNGHSAPAALEDEGRKKTRRRRSPSSSSNGSAAPSEAALTWQHDPSKFGAPQQSWNTATKSIWLMYVVSQVLNQTLMTSKQIQATFNKNFRQAGTITLSNVARDLGKQKAKGKASPIGEDNSTDPSGWFLTETGNQQAQELIAKSGS